MDDLNTSPLFDGRHIKFLAGILQQRPLAPISAIEQKLLRKSKQLCSINEQLSYELLPRVQRWQKFVSVQEILAFLIETDKRGKLDHGMFILDTTITSERSPRFKDLMKIFKDSEKMPVDWAVALHSNDLDERHAKKPRDETPPINLEALKDFR